MIWNKKKDGAENPGAETPAAQTAKAPVLFLQKNWKWLVPGVCVVIAGGVFLLKPKNASTTAVDPSYLEASPEVRDVSNTLSGTGTLNPANTYTVKSLVEGKVLTGEFEEGDVLDEGSILYTLDSSDASTNFEKAEIAMQQAQRSYDKVVDRQYVRAEVDGTVSTLKVAKGDEVTSGQEVAIIRDSSKMLLTLEFPAADAANFSVGQTAQVTLDGTFEQLDGTVTSVTGTDALSTGNLLTRTVTIAVRNAGGLTTAQAATASINGVSSIGSATFGYQAERTLTAQAAGTVTSIHVQEGQTVAKDDILIELSGDDLTESIQSASETLRSAEISLQNLQDTMNNYTITAPISGTVVEKSFKAGDKIESEALSAANGTLATLYDMSQLTFRMAVNELDINKVAVGQQVEITTQALSGQTFTGTVDKVNINGTTTNGFTTYPITVRLDGDGTELARQGLRPGMNVSAKIIGQSVENALCVPVGAVSRGNKLLVAAPGALAQDGTTVLDPTKTEERQVALGVSDDSYVQILSGLSQGETVLVPDQGQDQVQIQPGGSAAMAGSGGEG